MHETIVLHANMPIFLSYSHHNASHMIALFCGEKTAVLEKAPLHHVWLLLKAAVVQKVVGGGVMIVGQNTQGCKVDIEGIILHNTPD